MSRKPQGSWLAKLRELASVGVRGGQGTAARVAVVTDSAASLPEAWLEPFGAGAVVIPVPVLVEGQEIGDDDVARALPLALAAGTPVSTSRPAPARFAAVYGALAEAGFQSIVSIHLSAKLSGTAEAARTAADQVASERGIHIRVVDSQTAGLAQGFLVMDALAAAAAGADVATVEAAARPERLPMMTFVVPSLEQLRRGGRISRVSALVGTVLAVKPLLTIQDGSIQAAESPRTLPRAVARLVEVSRTEAAMRAREGRRPRIAVHCFGTIEAAEDIRHELLDLADGDVPIVPVPAVIGAHTGVGVLAVVVA